MPLHELIDAEIERARDAGQPADGLMLVRSNEGWAAWLYESTPDGDVPLAKQVDVFGEAEEAVAAVSW
jgi:hypothetical protein